MRRFRFKGKKVLAGILAAAMVITVTPAATAKAQDTEEKYPYTLFAGSKENGAITVNAENLCVNGAVITNGTIAVNGTVNVNGERTENASVVMVELGTGLDKNYFAEEGKEVHSSDYLYENDNVLVNVPLEVNGDLTLSGNMNLNAGLKAKEDIILSGNSLNANQAVVYAESGDITLDFYNINFTGLIYAPEGEVSITAPYANLNSVIVIAETITIDTMYANVNYNDNMAQFITENAGVAEDEEESGNDEEIPGALEFYAYGSYNADTNCVDIEWYSKVEAEAFEVLSSADNAVYQTEAVVTGSAYAYSVTEEFDVKYFKVTMKNTDGECKETLPFMIVKGESGYETELFDTDGDEIPDIFEAMFGTDAENADTDEDDLTDYEELYLTGTDPVVFDSVTEGLGDAKADCDGDGLINKEELVLGTNPLLGDTDDDLFSDFDEVNEYGTDPLAADTDEDGLKDGEEPLLGLDPKNPATFGVPDAEYQVEQSVSSESEVFAEVNTEENPYRMSLDIVAAGYVEGGLEVEESKYVGVMQNDAILGFVPELNYVLEDSIDKVTLRFEIDEEYTENTLGLFPEEEELTGIKRLNVFKYFEELNMLLPIETKLDEENNVLYTEVDELGTYCVMDMELWLESLGIMETEEAESMVYSMRPTAVQEETAFEGDMRLSVPVKETAAEENVETALAEEPMVMSARGVIKRETPVDIAFLIQIEGTSKTDYLLQKQMIIDVTQQIYNEYSDARVCIIGYGENEASIISSYTNPIWQENIGQVQGALGKIEYVETYEYCNRGAAFSLMSELDFKENAAKFVFHLANGNSGVQAGFFSELEVCAENNINYTEILPLGSYYLDPNFAAALKAAIDKTNGLSLTYTEETPEIVYEHIVSHVAPAQYMFEVIVPNGWKIIMLDDILEKGSDTDTDKDGLKDWEEVNTELISWEADGTVVLPTLYECMQLTEKPYGVDGLKRFVNEKSDIDFSDFRWQLALTILYMNTEILPLISDPMLSDPDGDGYSDYVEVREYESNPLKSDVTFIRWDEGFISIDYAGPEKWKNFDGSTLSYGGAQGWVFDDKNEKWYSRLFEDYLMQEEGCGMVSQSDILLYLALINSRYSTESTDIVTEDDGIIEYSSYIDYLFHMNRNYFTTSQIGVVGFNLAIGMNNYSVENGLGLEAKWSVHQNKILECITEMLLEDLPVSLAIGMMAGENGVNFYRISPEEKEPYHLEVIEYESGLINRHYVTVTGVMIDEIKKRTLLEISSWGRKNYIEYNEYINVVKQYGDFYTSNILYVEKKR